jgi:hypothetical protein
MIDYLPAMPSAGKPAGRFDYFTGMAMWVGGTHHPPNHRTPNAYRYQQSAKRSIFCETFN